MNINPLSVTKFAASLVVGIGTGKIVGKAIKQIVTPTSMIEKVTIAAASWVIAGIATDATKHYTDDMIDNVAKAVDAVTKGVKAANKLDKVNSGTVAMEESGLDPAEYEKNDEDKWVRRHPKAITTLEAARLVNTNEWTYDFDKDVWTKKNGNGKGFLKQLKKVDGTTQWVLYEDA